MFAIDARLRGSIVCDYALTGQIADIVDARISMLCCTLQL